MAPGLVAELPTVPTAGESISCAARSKYDCRAALRLAVSLGPTAARLLLYFTACKRQLGWEIIIIIIIIKKISRAPIYHTRWQHRALYNNTNHTHTHTHTASK